VNPHLHENFNVDVRRFRPVLTVSLAALSILPSLWEAATGNLSFVSVLGRLALALVVSAVLVWLTTAVVLHYARVQLRSPSAAEAKREIEP
jgi:hypothetical protein